MARRLNATDAYQFVNAMVKEISGENATIQAVDPTSFIAVGEFLMQSDTEKIYNALGIVYGRVFADVRPYDAKYSLIDAVNASLFASIERDISFYSREAEASGDWNTQLYTNFVEGYDNGSNNNQSTASMWVQNHPVPLELDFGGFNTWEDSTTILKNQLEICFRDESQMVEFLNGVMTERANDIEQQKEGMNRALVISHISSVYQLNAAGKMPKSVVNLTAEFNAKFGTSYTSAQLRSTYLKEFLEFFVATVKTNSRNLTHRTVNYHWFPAKTINGKSYVLKRHTPLKNQKLFLFNPLITDAESMVLPEIFNDQLLNPGNYEGVDFWQNENVPAAIKTSKWLSIDTNGAQKVNTAATTLDYVVGMQFDDRALAARFYLEDSETTPIEARKRYRNIWWTFARKYISNLTQNCIVYIMADPAS